MGKQMSRHVQVWILFVATLCFMSLSSKVNSEDVPQHPAPQYHIQGQVFCDVCRAGFVTEISEYMPGAGVFLQCSDKENGPVTFSAVGYSRAEGLYSLLVDQDFHDMFCEITLDSSSRKDCDEVPVQGWVKQSFKFKLNTKNGTTATAGPLGFYKKEVLPKCVQIFNKLGMYPSNL